MVVLQPDAPQILLSGTAHFARPAVDFEGPEGVPLFPDLQITCSISHQVEAKADESWQGTGKDNPKSDWVQRRVMSTTQLREQLQGWKGFSCVCVTEQLTLKTQNLWERNLQV